LREVTAEPEKEPAPVELREPAGAELN